MADNVTTLSTKDDIRIIYSNAYTAINDWRSAVYKTDAAEENLKDAQDQKKRAGVAEKTAKERMLNALMDHYGTLPDAIDFMGQMLLIDATEDSTEVRMVKAKSYCDLYTVIRPEAEAA